jgi:hypothetical protein
MAAKNNFENYNFENYNDDFENVMSNFGISCFTHPDSISMTNQDHAYFYELACTQAINLVSNYKFLVDEPFFKESINGFEDLFLSDSANKVPAILVNIALTYVNKVREVGTNSIASKISGITKESFVELDKLKKFYEFKVADNGGKHFDHTEPLFDKAIQPFSYRHQPIYSVLIGSDINKKLDKVFVEISKKVKEDSPFVYISPFDSIVANTHNFERFMLKDEIVPSYTFDDSKVVLVDRAILPKGNYEERKDLSKIFYSFGSKIDKNDLVLNPNNTSKFVNSAYSAIMGIIKQKAIVKFNN